MRLPPVLTCLLDAPLPSCHTAGVCLSTFSAPPPHLHQHGVECLLCELALGGVNHAAATGRGVGLTGRGGREDGA